MQQTQQYALHSRESSLGPLPDCVYIRNYNSLMPLTNRDIALAILSRLVRSGLISSICVHGCSEGETKKGICSPLNNNFSTYTYFVERKL